MRGLVGTSCRRRVTRRLAGCGGLRRAARRAIFVHASRTARLIRPTRCSCFFMLIVRLNFHAEFDRQRVPRSRESRRRASAVVPGSVRGTRRMAHRKAEGSTLSAAITARTIGSDSISSMVGSRNQTNGSARHRLVCCDRLFITILPILLRSETALPARTDPSSGHRQPSAAPRRCGRGTKWRRVPARPGS